MAGERTGENALSQDDAPQGPTSATAAAPSLISHLSEASSLEADVCPHPPYHTSTAFLTSGSTGRRRHRRRGRLGDRQLALDELAVAVVERGRLQVREWAAVSRVSRGRVSFAE